MVFCRADISVGKEKAFLRRRYRRQPTRKRTFLREGFKQLYYCCNIRNYNETSEEDVRNFVFSYGFKNLS